MGKTKVRSYNTLTNQQSGALDNILRQSQSSNNLISDYLQNLITQGPSSARTQQAVGIYNQQFVPQALSQYGSGKSSSALNQALSAGAQNLTQNLSADTMSALGMLQNLAQSNTALGLGTQAKGYYLEPSTGSQILSGLLQLAGMGLNFSGQNLLPILLPNLLNSWYNKTNIAPGV